MEIRYFLGKTFLTDNDQDIDYFDNEIKARGYCNPIESGYRVYSGRLATLFIAVNLPAEIEAIHREVTGYRREETENGINEWPIVVETGGKEPGIIQGKDFADVYQTEYDRGKAWFNQTYPLTNLLSNAETYLPKLRKLYFYDRIDGIPMPGLRSYKEIWPNPITLEWVKRIGFHSGIIAEMERLDELHLPLFSDLEEWQHNKGDQKDSTNPNQTKNGKTKKSEVGILADFPGYGLSERERVLIHCYKNLSPILSGCTGYSDYLKFARPTDRVRYPNESIRKARSLIRSINKILPHLIDSEKQQAKSEIDTIQAAFDNQL